MAKHSLSHYLELALKPTPSRPPLARYRRNTGWVWAYVGCEGLQERHLYSRINFKLNRAAALAEWRQLLSA